jgi:hypothetical protein
MAEVNGDGRRVQKNLRMSPSLLKQLQKAAKRERRTETEIIEQALKEYLSGRAGTNLPDELIQAVEDYLERHR